MEENTKQPLGKGKKKSQKEVGAKSIAMSSSENSSSSNASSPSDSKVKVSSLPEQYFTHFMKLRPSTRKGQTRFRCKTCLHEFECSGKIRRIQHILGNDLIIAKEKNVRSCSKPYAPLKAALLDLYRSATGEKEMTSPNLVERNYEHASLLNSSSADTYDSDSWEETIAHLASIPLNEDPVFSPIDLYAHQQTNFAHANGLLIKFLYQYDLPLTAVEDPILINFIEAIAATDSDYYPSLLMD